MEENWEGNIKNSLMSLTQYPLISTFYISMVHMCYDQWTNIYVLLLTKLTL